MPNLQGMIIGAAATLFLALSGVIVWQHLALKNAAAQYDAAVSAQAVLAAANNNFKLLADRQNAAVVKLKAAQAARATAAAKAAAKAKQDTSRYAALAAIIENQKPAGSDCENAQAVLKTYFAGRR